MMDRRRAIIRTGFLVLVLVALVPLVSGYLAYQEDSVQQYDSPHGKVSAAEELTVVTTAPTRERTNGQLVAVNESGTPVYRNSTFDKYYDVDPTPDGKYTVEYVAGKQLDAAQCGGRPASSGCKFVVFERLNLSTGEVERVLQRYAPLTIYHDVDRINRTHLLVADMDYNRVYILNTSSGLITWEWRAQTNFSVQSGGFYPEDWTHLNDVEYLDDGRIMVSLRNLDQIVFIDRDSGIDQTWTLGTENRQDILYEQHNPDYLPSSHGGPAVLVADSENSRVIEYQRTRNGSWQMTWGWQDGQLQWPRDADRLPNDHTLVTDSNGNRVLEIDENGKVVWKILIDTPYDAERLGTGPESEGGTSASSSDLASLGPDIERGETQSGGADGQSPLKRIKLTVKSVIPSLLINGLIFLLPPWIGFGELVYVFALSGIGIVWMSTEFRWSSYQLRWPFYRGD